MYTFLFYSFVDISSTSPRPVTEQNTYVSKIYMNIVPYILKLSLKVGPKCRWNVHIC